MIFSRLLKSQRGNIRNLTLLVLIGMVSALCVGMVSAQKQVITDDEVNEIAGKLYCPVCENIPLDACGTAACADWRYEIRLQLEQGMTEQQIIDDFVLRFGDRVVGTPQDPTLRLLSLATPYVALLLAIIATVVALIRLRKQPDTVTELENDTSEKAKPNDHYRDLLEQDLS